MIALVVNSMCANRELFSPSDERVTAIIGRLRTKEICNHCLGRLVGKIGHGYTNDERGRLIRKEFSIPPLAENESCWLCHDLFNRLEPMAAAAIERLSEIDYESFAIGSRLDPGLIDREESLWAECGSDYAELIKAEINREVGKRVEGQTEKIADTTNPDVISIIDVNFLDIELEISSLFIYGRYRKYDRSIPQTKWPCRRCRGKGCDRCGFTGKMYQESVEELIAKEFLTAARAENTSFHGMGREDIDARMLGNGRPFILELKRPLSRKLSLVELEEKINRANEGRVEIFGLRMSSKEEVRRLKESRAEKSYRVIVQLDAEKDSTKLKEMIGLLIQDPIEQRTPHRVAHRRADRVRRHRIIEAELEELEGQIATIRLRATAGTYIKELMHGDEGRTRSSLAELLGTKDDIIQLDVIGIHDESDNDG